MRQWTSLVTQVRLEHTSKENIPPSSVPLRDTDEDLGFRFEIALIEDPSEFYSRTG